MGGGAEVRNAWWSEELKQWEVKFADVLTLAQYKQLRSHFLARRARVRSFPFNDYTDSTASTDAFATGNGTAGPFQLSVARGDAGNAYTRTVYLVVPTSETIFVNGSAKVRGTDYTINNSTGQVTFLASHFPANGTALTWTGSFYIPARWDMTEGDFADLFVYVANGTQLVQTAPARFAETRDYS